MMSFPALLCIASIGLSSSLLTTHSHDDGKFKVFRITPVTNEQLELLATLYKNSADLQLDFWKAPTTAGQFADVMVEPDMVEPFRDILTNHSIPHKVTIEDVQKLTVEREGGDSLPKKHVPTGNPLLGSFFRRLKDYSSRNKAHYGFGEYHSYNEMIRWMNDIAYYYPTIAKVFTLGKTHEGRNIKGLKIGNPVWSTDKRVIWIDAGIHAREWASVHTALYFIDQLISGYGHDPAITNYIDNLNFYITPVLNPDGYEYSRSDISPQTRFWRKNRGPQICTKDRWHRERCCGGVDLNRNFDFHWGESGSSNDMCSEIYEGPSAFSEPESRAVRDMLLSPELAGKTDAFITLHTYSQMWIHPYSHLKKTVPNDIRDLESVGKNAVNALEDVYGTRYRFGTGADILYPSSGGSDDWSKSVAGVKYVYLLELRPGEEEWDGFLLDRRQLIPTGRETWAGVRVVIDAVLRTKRDVLSYNIPASQYLYQSTTKGADGYGRQIQTQLPNHMTLTETAIRSQRLRNEIRRRLNLMRGSTSDRRRLEWRALYPDVHLSRPLTHQSDCHDVSFWCSKWILANPGICQTSSIYMNQNCKKSCNFC
ncbi:hypothetical protein AB6A40_000117 [Gnathostoma spinigerum]|uniref:Zinc carboxypeptidase A 1 n=1 Tax=Gnathostoma spinigerum TaxID=75299 RepID=A0ABD6E9L8_9BILA